MRSYAFFTRHFPPNCLTLPSVIFTPSAPWDSSVPLPHTANPPFRRYFRLSQPTWMSSLVKTPYLPHLCSHKTSCLNRDAPLGRAFSPEASRESCVPQPLTDRGAVLLQGDDGLGLVRPGGGRGSGVVFLEEIWFFHILLERWVGLCPMGSGDHVDL